MPQFVRKALIEHGLLSAYKSRPPYQRNDYLGWISSAKREATKKKRLDQMIEELKAGNKYMKMSWSGKSDA
jgi:uncharacterized protein YdeI (YjbR/CyaY-like superfamily)